MTIYDGVELSTRFEADMFSAAGITVLYRNGSYYAEESDIERFYAEAFTTCAACGEPADYCLGNHGEPCDWCEGWMSAHASDCALND